MKKVLLVFCLALGLTAHASAQSADSTACVASIRNGTAHWYYPTVKVDSARRLPNGRDSIRAPLEHNACVYMNTVAYPRGGWVPLREGTQMRWFRRPDGTLELYAHNGCGNDASRFVYVYTEAAPTRVEQIRGERGERGPMGQQGPAGRDGRDGTNGHDGRDAKGPSFWKVVGISVGSAIVVGAIGCVTEIFHCGHHHALPPMVHTDSVSHGPGVTTDSATTTKPTGPGVGTDSVGTYDGRCQSNDPRNCPNGMRRPTGIFATLRSRPIVGLLIDPRNKRVGVNVNIPFTLRM